MSLSLPFLMSAILTGAGPSNAAAATWSIVAEGPMEQVVAAKAEMARCRFSQIDVAPTGDGRGRLRIPAGELIPRRAVCLNNVADTLATPALKWFGPDLHLH